MKDGYPMKHAIRWLVLFLTLTAVSIGWVRADDAQLDNIIVTNTRDDLLLYLNASNAFNKELTTAIQSGVEITFTYFIRLNRIRSFWKDEAINKLNITHTIAYDTLKDEYRVTRSWEKQNHTVKSFDAAHKLMVTINSLVISPLADLSKGQQYRIRVKAEQKRRRLPYKMHYVLFFMSLRDFETDWYTIDFIY